MTIDTAKRCNVVLRRLMMEDAFADAFDALNAVMEQGADGYDENMSPAAIENEIHHLRAQMMREIGD